MNRNPWRALCSTAIRTSAPRFHLHPFQLDGLRQLAEGLDFAARIGGVGTQGDRHAGLGSHPVAEEGFKLTTSSCASSNRNAPERRVRWRLSKNRAQQLVERLAVALGSELFTSAPEARILADRWRWEYNTLRAALGPPGACASGGSSTRSWLMTMISHSHKAWTDAGGHVTASARPSSVQTHTGHPPQVSPAGWIRTRFTPAPPDLPAPSRPGAAAASWPAAPGWGAP